MSGQEIGTLAGLVTTGVGLAGTIVGWVKTTISNVKNKKLQKFIEEKMVEAEKLNLSGSSKKEFVIKAVKEYFGSTKKIIDETSKYIEECVAFSKKINAKK